MCRVSWYLRVTTSWNPQCLSRPLQEFLYLYYVLRERYKQQSSPVTGLEWPRGFREVKVPKLHDNGTGWW